MVVRGLQRLTPERLEGLASAAELEPPLIMLEVDALLDAAGKLNPAECWGWDGAQQLHDAATVDAASMMPLLLLRCKALRVEPCPGRRENAIWYVAPRQPAAAALLLA